MDDREVETVLVGREGAVGGIVSSGFLPAFCVKMLKFGGPFLMVPVLLDVGSVSPDSGLEASEYVTVALVGVAPPRTRSSIRLSPTQAMTDNRTPREAACAYHNLSTSVSASKVAFPDRTRIVVMGWNLICRARVAVVCASRRRYSVVGNSKKWS